MKEVKTERKVYDIHYEAIDGTSFTSREECEAYEGSARLVLKERFSKLVVDTSTEYDLFSAGSSEEDVYVVKVLSTNDVDTVLQYYVLTNSWVQDSDTGKEMIKELSEKLEEALAKDEVIFIGENYDGDLYLIDNLSGIMSKLSKFIKLKKAKKTL